MAVETPNAPAVQWISTASTFALALIGLDHFSIIWALVGSLGAQSRIESRGRMRAVAGLVMNTLLGALAGSAIAAAFFPATPQMKYMLCALAPVILSKYLFRFADALGDAVESSLPAVINRALGAGAPKEKPEDKQ